jgi:hypothetical protein
MNHHLRIHPLSIDEVSLGALVGEPLPTETDARLLPASGKIPAEDPKSHD